MAIRIAVGGLHIESCTFSPLLSREEDFSITRGQALLNQYPFLHDSAEVVHIPLLHARAVPGGPVERDFYRRFKRTFLEGLHASMPLDGIFLPMHGAVSVEGMQDAEGDFLTAVRAIVGPDCLLFASYDLHGNVSYPVSRSVDFLSAYRTAPHVDVRQTQERVYGALLHCLRENFRPSKIHIPVPILLPGEQTSTEWEPAASLYRLIPGILDGDAVMDASILIGYVWADEPRSSASVLVYGRDAVKVLKTAIDLAQRFWDARFAFRFGVDALSVDECIREAAGSAVHPVVISDSGDNPTAGGAGDTPTVLGRLIALGVRDTLVVGIADPAAVHACAAAGAGALVELSLGGKLDPLHAAPLDVTARVVSLHTLPWTLNPPGGGGVMNRTAVVDIGGIVVALTERRTPFHRIADFTSLGIDPHRQKIIVVKIGYLEPELKALAATSLLAFSPGAVDQDITGLSYRNIHRPMFPFDPQMEWSAAGN